jgi:II/X family phage/plasmid replication protein
MYDFNGLRIFFKDEFLHTTFTGDRVVSYVHIEECARRGLKIVPRDMSWHLDGTHQVHDLYHPWESLPSSFTGIAFKLYQASGFREQPCIELKASPAKITQGHNVFGSDSLELGVRAVFQALVSALPDFSKMLDFDTTEFFRIDSTFSIKLPNSDCLASALDSLARVSNRYLRPSRDGDYETTIYFNKVRGETGRNTGRSSSLCIYSKLDEVLHQIDDLKSKAKKEKTTRYNAVIEALEAESLQYFAMNRLRFEARICSRFFERHNLPTRVIDLLEFIRGYEAENGEGSFCRFLWAEAMKDLLDAISGQKITVVHDSKVKKLLHSIYDKIDKNGKLRTAKTVRLFGFYRRLCTEGYAKVKRTMGTTGKSSFYNAVNDLKAAGFSKAQLQNLDKKETLPLVHLLDFDFDAQRPLDYVEPEMPCPNLNFSEFLAVISGDVPMVDDALTLDKRLAIALDTFGLNEMFVTGLKAGRDVRLNGERSLSLALWADGEFDLIEHNPNDNDDYRFKLSLARGRLKRARSKVNGDVIPVNNVLAFNRSYINQN